MCFEISILKYNNFDLLFFGIGIHEHILDVQENYGMSIL